MFYAVQSLKTIERTKTLTQTNEPTSIKVILGLLQKIMNVVICASDSPQQAQFYDAGGIIFGDKSASSAPFRGSKCLNLL